MGCCRKRSRRRPRCRNCGVQTLGYYFALTDRNPPPTEYKDMIEGICLTGEVMIVFTFLHHDVNLPEKELALRMLKEGTHSK